MKAKGMIQTTDLCLLINELIIMFLIILTYLLVTGSLWKPDVHVSLLLLMPLSLCVTSVRACHCLYAPYRERAQCPSLEKELLSWFPKILHPWYHAAQSYATYSILRER